MKITRFVRVVVAFGAIAACLFALAACGNNSNAAASSVAATVDGEEIAEQKVTDQIQQIREQSNLSEEEQWGTFLAQSGMTPSSVREQIIDTLVNDKLVVKGAAELGITVESSEVDEYVNQMKSNYGDDEAWKSALEQAGFTEDSYREVITQSLYEQKANEHFEAEGEMTDEDYVSAARDYASYYDGAKRSSHILFKVDDPQDEAAMADARAQAESVLARINDGSLDFADAAKQYSGDTGSAENGGDVGWDVMNSFVTEYTDALGQLELNQVSGLVQSDYGIHIIKVTEVYNAPEDTSTITSLDQLPAEFQESIKSMASSMGANKKYQEWIDGLKEKATIDIKEMPSGLPYDVDMSKYSSSSSEASSEEAATEVSEVSESSSASEAGSEAGESSSASEAGESASASASATEATEATPEAESSSSAAESESSSSSASSAA